MYKVFFSYSHRDEELRNGLEIHLSALKRQGIIEAWHDRKIPAGSEVDPSIMTEMEESDIILLLISPYFIASNYCYEVEMNRALERHQDGTAVVIPVILHMCDWHGLPFGKLLATPDDGKPVSKLTKTKGGFPNENSLLKLLYAGILNASKKWTMPIQNWNMTLSQLAIHFEGRLDGVLDI